MSDWKFLETCRVGIQNPALMTGVPEAFHGSTADGWNGLFRIVIDGRLILVIRSDGEGWQHVSVSEERSRKPVPWDIMCKVKDLFFEDEDVVVQFHPKKSQYVNNHPGCLHLWRCTSKEFPTPEAIMVVIL